MTTCGLQLGDWMRQLPELSVEGALQRPFDDHRHGPTVIGELRFYPHLCCRQELRPAKPVVGGRNQVRGELGT